MLVVLLLQLNMKGVGIGVGAAVQLATLLKQVSPLAQSELKPLHGASQRELASAKSLPQNSPGGIGSAPEMQMLPLVPGPGSVQSMSQHSFAPCLPALMSCHA